MSDIRINIEAMQQAAGQFAAQSVELADLISQVRRDILSLQELWQGPAAKEFASLMADWHKDVSDIQRVLEQVAQQVQSAGIGYGDLEEQIRIRFQGY